MALSQTIVGLLVGMRRAGLFNFGGTRVLDLGEQNLYGDMRGSDVVDIARMLKLPDARIVEIEADVAKLTGAPPSTLVFDLAKVLYRVVFDCVTYRAIDLNGTEVAWRYDLNRPLPTDETFHVVTNFGTSEHVFDQAQIFRSIHALARPGGLMLHALPHQGGPNHGFFNYHPTFFHDLAAANGYRIAALFLMTPDGEGSDRLDSVKERDDYATLIAKSGLTRESGLFVGLVKPNEERPFKPPMQGYYAGELSEEGRRAWESHH